MPERARTDLWEPWGSNPPGPPGPDPNVARLRPHGGNSRPEGIVQSYFVRQQKDILVKHLQAVHHAPARPNPTVDLRQILSRRPLLTRQRRRLDETPVSPVGDQAAGQFAQPEGECFAQVHRADAVPWQDHVPDAHGQVISESVA
jgi:hypothetical protein